MRIWIKFYDPTYNKNKRIIHVVNSFLITHLSIRLLHFLESLILPSIKTSIHSALSCAATAGKGNGTFTLNRFTVAPLPVTIVGVLFYY